jgi:monofunctional biosynthetic peptidoglycan transglycosylase
MARPRRAAWRTLGYALAALAAAALAVQGWFFVRVVTLRWLDPASTAFMERRLEALRGRDRGARLQYQWVPYGRISMHLKRAVVAAEDARFVEHEGFDWPAIQKALEENQRRGKVVSGASTISQQLAKNLFLSGERSWLRKGQEAAITWMLEQTLPKRRILELYLNVAEWGEGVFGAEAAARHHFGRPAHALDAREAAWLAVVLPSPRRYARGRTTPYLARRVETILARMSAAQVP